jgi:hypothetical protein
LYFLFSKRNYFSFDLVVGRLTELKISKSIMIISNFRN